MVASCPIFFLLRSFFLLCIHGHGIFFMGVGLYYISQNFGRGVNFSGGIFGYYCIFITKYFRKTSEVGWADMVGRLLNRGVRGSRRGSSSPLLPPDAHVCFPHDCLYYQMFIAQISTKSIKKSQKTENFFLELSYELSPKIILPEQCILFYNATSSIILIYYKLQFSILIAFNYHIICWLCKFVKALNCNCLCYFYYFVMPCHVDQFVQLELFTL